MQSICFALFAVGGGLFIFGLSAFTYGFTARANFAVIAAYCGDLLGEKMGTAAFGLNTLFAGLGLVIGPTVAGVVADLTDSFTYVFWASASIALLGVLGALLLPGKPRPDRVAATSSH